MTGHGRTSVFSLIFGTVYTLAFYFNWPLFRFYPLVGEFHVGDPGKEAGPPILWYGWLAAAALVALPVAFAIPRRWSNRLSPTWSWLMPALLVLMVLIYEKRWFV